MRQYRRQECERVAPAVVVGPELDVAGRHVTGCDTGHIADDVQIVHEPLVHRAGREIRHAELVGAIGEGVHGNPYVLEIIAGLLLEFEVIGHTVKAADVRAVVEGVRDGGGVVRLGGEIEFVDRRVGGGFRHVVPIAARHGRLVCVESDLAVGRDRERHRRALVVDVVGGDGVGRAFCLFRGEQGDSQKVSADRG